jgi:hypothetical protein
MDYQFRKTKTNLEKPKLKKNLQSKMWELRGMLSFIKNALFSFKNMLSDIGLLRKPLSPLEQEKKNLCEILIDFVGNPPQFIREMGIWETASIFQEVLVALCYCLEGTSNLDDVKQRFINTWESLPEVKATAEISNGDKNIFNSMGDRISNLRGELKP